LTHVHWHLVAPRLAKDFTVVATDLRGYGDSGKPKGLPDHTNYSFRRMAQDQVDVMAQLGHKTFFVAGHDRGARTAMRMALDHPDKVKKFASFDILPTHHMLTHATYQWALNSSHWFFMAQKYPIPETLISGKEDIEFLGDDKEWLVQYSKRKLESRHYDYFIFGHRHLPLEIRLSEASKYINLGDWISHYTYAVFDGDQLSLERFEAGPA